MFWGWWAASESGQRKAQSLCPFDNYSEELSNDCWDCYLDNWFSGVSVLLCLNGFAVSENDSSFTFMFACVGYLSYCTLHRRTKQQLNAQHKHPISICSTFCIWDKWNDLIVRIQTQAEQLHGWLSQINRLSHCGLQTRSIQSAFSLTQFLSFAGCIHTEKPVYRVIHGGRLHRQASGVAGGVKVPSWQPLTALPCPHNRNKGNGHLNGNQCCCQMSVFRKSTMPMCYRSRHMGP